MQRGRMPMKDGKRISRRAALKAGVTVAAGTAALGASYDAGAAENPNRFENQPAIDPKRRILLKSGSIISMDAKIGDLVQGDVLIEGKRIAAIGPDLDVADAQLI